MKKKCLKLNDNYSHLSIGNIINAIKEESKNKNSAIQGEVFCVLFNLEYINESTVNNYCIGSRSIGNDYKQKYINLQKEYKKDETIFLDIVCNTLSIIHGTLYNIKNISSINKDESLKRICIKLYNISKNDFNIPKDNINLFRNLLKDEDFYNLFINLLLYAVLEKKQPVYEEDEVKNVVETILQNTNISVNDLQNFLILELNEGISFSHSLKKLANEGNPYANYHLAVLEYRGEFSGTPRFDKAYEYFLKAADNNHPSSCWMIGHMILRGKIGSKSESDYKKAVMYFEKAKDLGNVAAVNSLGLCYQHGLGVTKNLETALKHFMEAASKNYVYAYNNLGKYYETLNDFDNAYKCFLESAKLNESYACNKIGDFERKKGNTKEALYYFEKALDCHIAEISPWTYYNLAKYYYLNGDLESNTLKDENIAIQYFEKASTLIEALQELLIIYFEKYLVTKNEKYLEKITYYKELIENHKDYNERTKLFVEENLKNIKTKNPLEIPIDNI